MCAKSDKLIICRTRTQLVYLFTFIFKLQPIKVGQKNLQPIKLELCILLRNIDYFCLHIFYKRVNNIC